MRDGAMAFGPLEVVQLDVEVAGDLTLDGLDGQAGGRIGEQLGQRVARQLDRDRLPVERRTRRQTQDLFIDPSPPSGLLLVPGIDLERLARRCRSLGVEVVVDGEIYRTRSIPPGRGSGARRLDSSASNPTLRSSRPPPRGMTPAPGSVSRSGTGNGGVVGGNGTSYDNSGSDQTNSPGSRADAIHSLGVGNANGVGTNNGGGKNR